MKKNITFKKVLVSAVACATLMSSTAFAQEVTAVPISEILTSTEVTTEDKTEDKIESDYVVRTGKIVSVKAGQEGATSVELEVDGEIKLVANIQENTVVFDAEDTSKVKTTKDLKEGMTITCVIPAISPMTLSLPPITSSVVAVVINSEKGFFEVGMFNEELVNVTNTLKLNISEDTIITDLAGTKEVLTAEDVKNTESIVFYTVTTRSIPAQTNPSRVFVLGEVATTDSTPTPEVPAVAKLVGLRAEAEKMGYTVKWTSNDMPVVLEKEDKKIEVKLGEAKATVGGEVKELKLSTTLEAGIMMVSDEIIALM